MLCRVSEYRCNALRCYLVHALNVDLDWQLRPCLSFICNERSKPCNFIVQGCQLPTPLILSLSNRWRFDDTVEERSTNAPRGEEAMRQRNKGRSLSR